MEESKRDWLDEICPACNGNGADLKNIRKDEISPPKCPECGGTGRKRAKPKDSN